MSDYLSKEEIYQELTGFEHDRTETPEEENPH
jgi:hypothetical protein